MWTAIIKTRLDLGDFIQSWKMAYMMQNLMSFNSTQKSPLKKIFYRAKFKMAKNSEICQ